MRLIDADAFKKYITDGIDGLILPKDQVIKVIAITKSFLKDIDEQPTVEIPRVEWIPCSERLPEKNGRYLASWVSNLTNKYNIDSIFFAYGEWDCCNGDVEAWMPLPEPYKEEGE